VDDTLSYFTRLTATHENHPTKFLLATEACEGYLPWNKGPRLGSWTRAETYAHDILNDLLNFAGGWTDWNVFLDLQGGPNWAKNYVDAPIIVNTTNKEVFYKQPMYYYLGHFTKFLTPNSTRVGVRSTGTSPLEVVAFLTPPVSSASFDNTNMLTQHVVVVVLNRSNRQVSFDIQREALYADLRTEKSNVHETW